jgi:hypothetical protein
VQHHQCGASNEQKCSVSSIDYRCEDGRFPVSAPCVTISNPESLFSSQALFNPGVRSWTVD